jgi:hypothetical protein
MRTIQPGVQAMKAISILLAGAMAVGVGAGAQAQVSAKRSVSLVGTPLVMRLNNDEFRIAFGIDGKQCLPGGCSGLIHYRVHWTTPDGVARSEVRRVSYRISPDAARTIAVDRQYLDTAEGAHTTDIVGVSVERITCQDGAELSSL